MTALHRCHPDVVEAIHACHHLPQGRGQVRRAAEALALAQRVGGFDDELAARINLARAQYYVPTDDAKLAHYAWLRRALDGDHVIDEDDRRDIHWMLKWAIGLMLSTPTVPLETIRRTIDDVEATFLADGWQLRPIHAARASLAYHTGDQTAFEHHLTRWQATPRDGMTDCEACELYKQASLLHDRHPLRAIEVIHDVTEGLLTCAEEPARSLGLKAILGTEVGDVEATVDAYHRGWRLCRDNEALASTVADHLVALTRLGNVDRAIEHLLPRLGWLDVLSASAEQMGFQSAAALVLKVARAQGLAPELIGARRVDELADELASSALALSRQLDARFGTSIHSTRAAAWMDTGRVSPTPTLPPLHLGVTAPPQAVPTESIGSIAARLQSQLEAYDAGSAQTLELWLSSRSSLLASATAADAGAVALLDRLASRGRPIEESRQLLTNAVEAARRADDPVAARRAMAELALLPDAQGQQDVPAAELMARSLGDEGHVEEAGRTWAFIGSHTEPPTARLALERALDCLEQTKDRLGLALARVELARHEVGIDPQRARQLLDAAELEPGAVDAPVVAAQIGETRAMLAWQDGDMESAARHLWKAVASAEGHAGPALRARIMLCDLLVDHDDWPQLETAAKGLLAEATSLRHDQLLALGQRFLGLALVETGRHVEGAELLEAALPVLKDTAPDHLAPAAWALGGALSSLGEHDGARTAYATAAMGFEAQDRFCEASHAHLRAGNAAWGEDSSAAAVHFDAAVDFAAHVADAPLYAAAVRDRAGHRASQGETAAALMELDALVQEVQAMAAGQEQPLEQAYVSWLELTLLRQGARILDANGELASAVERLERAERAAAHDPRFGAICRAERGAVYARMGRLAEAESLIRDGLAVLDPSDDREVRVRTAGALAQALHDSGEVEAAGHLWDELVELVGNR